jgi:hypothetical protein
MSEPFEAYAVPDTFAAALHRVDRFGSFSRLIFTVTAKETAAGGAGEIVEQHVVLKLVVPAADEALIIRALQQSPRTLPCTNTSRWTPRPFRCGKTR